MDLVCEHGTLRIDFDRGVSIGRGGKWTDVPNSIEPDWMLNGSSARVAGDGRRYRDNTAVPVTGDYGRHIIACIEAAMISARERRDVEVTA